MSQQEMFDPMGGDPWDVARVSAADMREARHRWPQTLADLFDVIYAYNRRVGMADDTAERDATERTFLIADYIGPRMMYLPSGDKLRMAVRDLCIFRNPAHRDVFELARIHKMSVQQVYNIIGEQTRLVRDRLQGKLFE